MAKTITANDYKGRTTTPATTNKFYIKTTKGGYNRAALINSKTGSVLPNCVGAVHGMWLEAADNKTYSSCDKLCTGNAKSYYGFVQDGYERGNEPRLGAIACWKGGEFGHVGTVIKIYSDKSILCAMSDAENKVKWYTRKIEKDADGYSYNSFKFQGFIYNPYVLPRIGTATVKITNLRIRKSASTKSASLGYAAKKPYPVYEIKKNQGYTWYRIATDKWIASNGVWVTYKEV